MKPDYLLHRGRKYVQEIVDRPAQIWRFLHESELPPGLRHNPPGMPEVRPLFPNQFVPFTDALQRLSKAINDPRITPAVWSKFYTGMLWIANRQGFEMPGDPRNNYITGDTGYKNDPRVELLKCGGDLVAGYESGADVVVQVLDWQAKAPDPAWLLARPWFITHAVRAGKDGLPKPFPQAEQPNGEMLDFLHPFVGDPERYPRITVPRWSVQLWTEPELPDVYKLYVGV